MFQPMNMPIVFTWHIKAWPLRGKHRLGKQFRQFTCVYGQRLRTGLSPSKEHRFVVLAEVEGGFVVIERFFVAAPVCSSFLGQPRN